MLEAPRSPVRVYGHSAQQSKLHHGCIIPIPAAFCKRDIAVHSHEKESGVELEGLGTAFMFSGSSPGRDFTSIPSFPRPGVRLLEIL